MDKALGMAGLALRAGRLEVGEEAVGQACREKRCRLLLRAAGAAERTARLAERFAQEGQCLLLDVPWSKEELGAAVGRGQCALAAVTDLGLAQAIAQKLAAAEPERYGEAAERLALKAERARQRREKKPGRKESRPLRKYRKKS